MSYALAQERAITIVPKVTASISLLGSSFIILDIIRDKKKHRKTYYNLILCISCFDIPTSIGFFLGTWAYPASTGAYGASGTTGSCTFQGFFLQLGIGAPLYNLCLSVFYLLIIAYKWKDSRLKKAERWMHFCALLWAFATTFAGLPLTLYNPADDLWCWIAALPPECEEPKTYFANVPCVRGHHAWIYRYAFYYAPLWFAAFVIIVAMAKVSYVTWYGERASRKYRTSPMMTERNNFSDKTRRLTRQVHIQAVSYVSAFYITYSFPTIIWVVQSLGMTPPFGLYLCLTIFSPLQGFFNAVTYARPRYVRYRTTHPDSSLFNLCIKVVMRTIGSKEKTETPNDNADRLDASENGGETGTKEWSNSNVRRRSSIQNNAIGVVERDMEDDADLLDPGHVLQRHQPT